ncbi:MAG: hypothetical protein ACFFA3_05890 [Promethearchaeota archaeon]
MKIRTNLWILYFIGAILILVSILTPTSYNDSGFPTYYVWMMQIGVDVDPEAIYLLRTDIPLVIFSTILAIVIFSSSLIAITLASTYIRASLNYKKLRWKMIILACTVIISTLWWILMMEFFYNDAGYNHWSFTGGGYKPFLGVIGPFIGAVLMIIGSFWRREHGE